MKKFQALFFSVLVSFAASTVSFAAEKTNLLDNKTFSSQFTMAGQKESNPGEVTFKNGQVSTTLFKDFKAASYMTNKVKNRVTTFVAESKAAKGARLKWLGGVRDQQLDGTLIFYASENAKPEVYTLKGQLKQ